MGLLDKIGMTQEELNRKIEESYANGKDTKPDFQPVPAGKYIVNIVRAEIGETQEGKIRLSYRLDIVEGDYERRVLWKNQYLGSAAQVEFLLKDLKRLGVKKPTIQMIDEGSVFRSLAGLIVEIELKYKGDFSNVYFNRLVEGDANMDNETPF